MTDGYTLWGVTLDTCKNRAKVMGPAMAYAKESGGCVMGGQLSPTPAVMGLEAGFQTYVQCSSTKPFKSSGLLVTFDGTSTVQDECPDWRFCPVHVPQDECKFLDGYGSGFQGGALPGAYVGTARSRQECVDLVRSNHANATGAEWFSTRDYAKFMSPHSCEAYSDGSGSWDSTPPTKIGSCIAIVPS